MNQRHALIIGGGIGGLATAMRLQASQDFQVSLYEKNSTLGGRCNIHEAEGFRFDTGPSLLLMPDVYRELFAYCGEDFDELVPTVKLDPNYRIHFGDRSQLELTTDVDRMCASLEEIEPGAGPAYRRFLANAQPKYKIGRSDFVEKNFPTARHFFTLQNLKLLGKLGGLETLYSCVSRYFKDARLRQAFSMQSMYLGMSPFDAPAVYALLPYTELVEDGLYYPVGGMYQLVKAMSDVAKKLGVVVHSNSAVDSVWVQNGRAAGVIAGDQQIPADLVIANADLPYVTTDLLPVDNGRQLNATWEKTVFTSSAIVVHLGVEGTEAPVLHHNFFLSDNFKRNFDEIFDSKVPPTNPSYYLNVPTVSDPTSAPNGHQSWFLLIPVPHLTDQMKWNDDQITRTVDIVLDDLEQRLSFPLRDKTIYRKTVSPHDWKSDYNLKFGAAFGLGHGITQVGYFRPSNKSADLNNLYFVGASTVPGTGVPLVCLGAKLVQERIAADAA